MDKKFKKILLLLGLLLSGGLAVAQVPQGFNFQAVAVTNQGIPISNSEVGVRVSLLQGSETGDVIYSETHMPTTNIAGLMQIVIGEGTAESGTFSTINWAGGDVYVKLELDPAGGDNYEDLGATRLLSVPFAMVAQNVVEGGGTGSGEVTDFIEINKDDATLQDSLVIVRSGSVADGEMALGLQVYGVADGSNIPVFAEVKEAPENESTQYAVAGWADGPGTGTHIGVIGTADAPEATGNSRTGVYGQATSLAKYNYGMRGVAYGTGNGDQGEGFGEGSVNFGLRGAATNNTWGNIGLEADAYGEAGLNNYGVHGLSRAGTETTTKNYGVAGRASGPGINYGVYGSAWEGVENYAGYFDGDVNVNGTFTVNGEPLAGTAVTSLDSIRFMRLYNADGIRAAQLGATSAGTANMYFFNANQQATGWFGNYGIGGFMQIVGYNEDESYAGGTLVGSAAWNNNLPFFMMEGSSADPYVQLFTFGGRLNDQSAEVPYFNMQSTQRGIDEKPSLFSVESTNTADGKEAAQIMMYGDTSPLFQIGGETWDNPDMAFLHMYGRTPTDDGTWYQENLRMSVGTDDTYDAGYFYLYKTNISTLAKDETIQLDGYNGNIIITGSLSQSSDERLKDVIGKIDNPISKVLNLKGVYYKGVILRE